MENINDDWFPAVIPVKKNDRPTQESAPEAEWSNKEPDNIHEVMYQVATQGGFFKNLIYGIGGSENVR
tara:strand:- start:451 stop:654 length:204 start_codon:yes stop_codon:yes gene_type:complete